MLLGYALDACPGNRRAALARISTISQQYRRQVHSPIMLFCFRPRLPPRSFPGLAFPDPALVFVAVWWRRLIPFSLRLPARSAFPEGCWVQGLPLDSFLWI